MALLQIYRARLYVYVVRDYYKSYHYVCIQSSFQNIYRALLRVYRALLYVHVIRDSTSHPQAVHGDYKGFYYVCIQGSFQNI